MDGDNVVPVFGKWADITDPTFKDVTIDETMNDKAFTGVVTFKGTCDARSFTYDDRSILLLGEENTLYWPQSGASIGACRAYFQLADGITAADVNDARLFFGTNDTQGIEAIGQASSATNHDADAWYSLDGKRLNARPTTKGIYVRNGKKVVVK